MRRRGNALVWLGIAAALIALVVGVTQVGGSSSRHVPSAAVRAARAEHARQAQGAIVQKATVTNGSHHSVQSATVQQNSSTHQQTVTTRNGDSVVQTSQNGGSSEVQVGNGPQSQSITSNGSNPTRTYSGSGTSSISFSTSGPAQLTWSNSGGDFSAVGDVSIDSSAPSGTTSIGAGSHQLTVKGGHWSLTVSPG